MLVKTQVVLFVIGLVCINLGVLLIYQPLELNKYDSLETRTDNNEVEKTDSSSLIVQPTTWSYVDTGSTPSAHQTSTIPLIEPTSTPVSTVDTHIDIGKHLMMPFRAIRLFSVK